MCAALLQMIGAYHSTNPNSIRNPLTHGRNSLSSGRKRADAIAELHEHLFSKKEESEEQKLLNASLFGTMENNVENLHGVENYAANKIFDFFVRWVL